jgi:polyhydroxyalkanoate synthesis regulator phasin
LHFSIFNFQCFILAALIIISCGIASEATAQSIPDKIVASVTNGSQATPDIITYSDLVWQLALEPGRASPARPSAEELKQALDTLVQQTLVLQEAKKLPLAQTPEAQKEFEKKVQDRLEDVIHGFGSRALLEERMKLVGLTSEQLDLILRDRQTMDSYVDFRFRAFAVVSTKEISDRYEKLYGPQRGSGRIVKTLDQARDEIERDLTEEKIGKEIDNFIDRLMDQPGTEIVILNPV